MNVWKSLITWLVFSQRMFSSLRSRWAIPAEKHIIIAPTKTNTLSLDWDSCWGINQPFVCRKWSAWAMSLTTLLASNSSKCFRFWIWVRMDPERAARTCNQQKPFRIQKKCDCWVGQFTPTELFKHQIKAGAVFKELNQFQNVPALRYWSGGQNRF